MNQCDNKVSVLLSCALPAYNVSKYISDCVMFIIGRGWRQTRLKSSL